MKSEAPARTVDVTCSHCGQTASVASRQAVGSFEERHRTSCGSGLNLSPVLDEILDLPPY